ncbi:unnamed protein product [Urochloa humidicola]
MLLDSSKEEMNTLPADESSSEFLELLLGFRSCGTNFSKLAILTLARSFLRPSQANGALMVSEDLDESDVYVKNDSSGKLAVSVAESKNELDAKLNGLDIDQQSEVQVKGGKTSEAMVTDKEKVGMTDLYTKLESSLINPSSESSFENSGAGSNGENGQQY